MSDQRIIVGSDHAGLALKYELLKALAEWGWTAEDIGAYPLNGQHAALSYDAKTGTLNHTGSSVDYPDYAIEVSERVARGEAPLGLLLCGTGIGMSITANKINGIRAALCHDPYSAKMTRAHNDANVLCIGARIVGLELARTVLKTFLETPFEGGRHQRRIDKITSRENNGDR